MQLYDKNLNEPNDIDFTKLACIKNEKMIFDFTVTSSMNFASNIIVVGLN